MADLTVEDSDALDCPVCFLPLKPPIFQCAVGHVVCSACRDKLAAATQCHMCRAVLTGGYRRCHAMERVVEAIRETCPNEAYGCDARLPRCGHQDHLGACPHKPCRCPAEDCGFAGAGTALLDHFTGAHGWQRCDAPAGETVSVHLRDGFNVVTVVGGAGRRYLFLLFVARKPLGRAVTALCVHRRADVHEPSSSSPSRAVEFFLKISYSRYRFRGGKSHRFYHQEAKFDVPCADLSNGLPNRDEQIRFVMPKDILPDDELTMRVSLCVDIK